MSSFRILSGDGPDPKRGYAIGLDTGTLFYMISDRNGIVLAGKGFFKGLEGECTNAANGGGVRFLPRGTKIEIEV